jgi:hypothetical protein
MPYNQRLQLLDLLFWRVIQYGSRQEFELKNSETLPAEAGEIFSSAYEDAERAIESFRSPGEVTHDEIFRLIEEEYLYRRRGPRLKDFETNTFFYPTLVQVRYKRSLLDELLSQEKLGLATASLATAALSFELYHIEAIQSINPLKIKITLKDALAVIGVLVVAIGMGATLPEKHRIAERCASIVDEYQAELAMKHIDPEHALMLGEGLKACYASPIFNASPISLEIGEEKP